MLAHNLLMDTTLSVVLFFKFSYKYNDLIHILVKWLLVN